MIFDQVIVNDVNRAKETIEYASGKSINAARVAHTLGKKVLATGFLGAQRGQAVRDDLDRDGIPHAFVDVQPQTRLCVTFVERAAHRATELIEETLPIDPADWRRLDQQLDSLRPTAKVVVCSGSLPPNGPTDFYARQVQKKLQDQHIILDGRGPVIHAALQLGQAFILKLNLVELAATVDAPAIATQDDLASAMRKALPRDGAIIVTMGSTGAIAANASGFWSVAIPKIQPVNAIGSGDAFAAGLACALAENHSWPDTLKLASACAVANALTPLAGHVNVEDVRKLESQIIIRDGLHFAVH